jgi:hypothetical protein
MKTQLTFLWVMLFAHSFAFAQNGTWEKFVQRSEKGAEIFWIQTNETRVPTQVQYQPLNSKTKITLAYVSKGGDGGVTEQDYAIFKNNQTGATYKMFGFMMGGLVVMPDGAQKEFYPENTYAYNTERLYITPPPIVAYVYYSNNSLPIAQPMVKDACDQVGGDATWNCEGIVPVTKAKCTIKYEADKNIITLTTPKGTKVFKEVKE